MAYINLLELVYPVGSIYISMSSTNPGALFGGTWVQINNRFLYATTSSMIIAGENIHTLTVDEMPAHNHSGTIVGIGSKETFSNSGIFGNEKYKNGLQWNTIANGGSYDVYGETIYTSNNTGSGKAHNNMPAYITCYGWYRTA